MPKRTSDDNVSNLIDSAIRYQNQNPESTNFISLYQEGKGWIFTDAKTRKTYCKDSFFKKFGYYPALPHPSELSEAGNVVRMQPLGDLPPDKNPRP